MTAIIRPLALTILAAAAAAPAARAQVAITNVDVIPMDRDRVLRDHTVLVRGDRIVEVGPTSRVRLPQGTVSIDGRGKFLMPGLAEMHAHIPPGNATDAEIEKVLAFYVLNGVTTVRGMLGAPRHLEYRAWASTGEILSPTIYTTGPSLNGNSVPTVDAGIRAVTEQKAAGYDLMKIHPGIRRDVYDSIAATAARLSIRFAGHVPLDVGIVRALEAGQWTVDHVDGYLEGLVRSGSPVPATQSQFFGYNLVPHLDESKLAALVAATKRSGAWIVPTQSLFESMLGGEDPEALAARPEMKFWPAATVANWKQATASTRSQQGVTAEGAAAYLGVRRRVMLALRDAGVPFLLGSDAPQWWNVPGFSIQRELDAMVKAGFTPYQLYESGSRNVAAYFGATGEFGTIEAGKRADLVLLDANPLESVANWSRRAGVMVRGKWYDRAEIDRRLADLSR